MDVLIFVIEFISGLGNQIDNGFPSLVYIYVWRVVRAGIVHTAPRKS